MKNAKLTDQGIRKATIDPVGKDKLRDKHERILNEIKEALERQELVNKTQIAE